jgi:hypothetical protein
MKMGAEYSSETLVSTINTTQSHSEAKITGISLSLRYLPALLEIVGPKNVYTL